MREYTQYYKDGKPCYKGFTVYGCGTSTFYKEIDKEEYDRLSSMSYGEVDKEIKNNLSDSIIYGYGYYGHDLLQEKGCVDIPLMSSTKLMKLKISGI